MKSITITITGPDADQALAELRSNIEGDDLDADVRSADQAAPRDMPDDTFVVICLEHEIGYVLATRQTFGSRASAAAYAATVAASRAPLVVAGRWGQLRQPQRDTY